MTRLIAKNITLLRRDKIICRALSFSAKPGDRLGILGPNGSGKTSLLHTLMGLSEPNKGEIILNGSNIQTLSMKSIATAMAILFQDFTAVFPQTVWDYCKGSRYPHLSYFKKMSRKDNQLVLAALKKMDAENFCTRLITELSGGEKRRIAIAALLAREPSIYLLDEPTNHLDIRYQFRVLEHFNHLTETANVTTIMSLHDVNVAQTYCNQILLLFSNGDTLIGSPEEILTMENLTRLYEQPMVSVKHDDKVLWIPKNLA